MCTVVRNSLMAACLGLGFALAWLASAGAQTPAAKQIITLEQPKGWDLQLQTMNAQGKALQAPPANFMRLGQARHDQPGEVHALTLNFAAATTLTAIKSTEDFPILQGGTCHEGAAYPKNSSCTLLVRFTPQGAGHRRGDITITHSASPEPAHVGLLGMGYAPVVSFTPALMTLVPGTYPSGSALLNNAHSLAADGGDVLLVADTGNNTLRWMDPGTGVFSSFTDRTYTQGVWGVGSDDSGTIYFSAPASNRIAMRSIEGGDVGTFGGPGLDNCSPFNTPLCSSRDETFNNPTAFFVTADGYLYSYDVGTMYGVPDGGFAVADPYGKFARYYDYYFMDSTSPAIAVDDEFNIYLAFTSPAWSVFEPSTCQIYREQFVGTSAYPTGGKVVAGSQGCGYGGDGGQARSAKISLSVGQLALDVAGNLYFTDTGNQRLRRIDRITGVIRTIAGNGTAGFTSTSGPATSAMLSSPTGVAIDSQGQIYVITSTSTSDNSHQVIQKLGPQGAINFPDTALTVPSAAQTVTVSNTGNQQLELTKAVITGVAATDFAIDDNTTTCLLMPMSTLAAGASCRIGVIFTPTAGGTRQANLTLLDDTISGADTVVLTGSGSLPQATLRITAPTSGQTFTAGSVVTVTAAVTSVTSPAPTGTVQFSVDGTSQGAPQALVSGSASLPLPSGGLAPGSHTASAVYSGDANYAASSVVTVGFSVVQAPSITTINSPGAGQSIQIGNPFTASASVTSTGGIIPTGTIQFKVDGASVGSAVTTASGVASTSITFSTVGSHILTAVYSGDTTFSSSTSAGVTVTAILPLPAITVVSPTSGQIFTPGTAVPFQVTVTSTGTAPTGTVQFRVDGAAYGSAVTLTVAGAATTSVSGLAAGSHTLTAVYNGDAHYSAATSTAVPITVGLPPAKLAITLPADGASIKSGVAISLTASVSSDSAPTPTGTVRFQVDGVNYGSLVTVASNKASISVTGLAVGSHRLSATYNGDTHYSVTGPVSITVSITPASSVTIMAANNMVVGCGGGAVVAKVSGGSAAAPTGTVQVLEGSTVLATGTLSAGKATVYLPKLSSGTHKLVAQYLGDSSHPPAVSTELVETIRGALCLNPAGR